MKFLTRITDNQYGRVTVDRKELMSIDDGEKYILKTISQIRNYQSKRIGTCFKIAVTIQKPK